jgi:prepilin-type N-terminal cleavage/methylation domain-containing protein
MKPGPEGGYSLIEILVVLGIVALLVAIAVPFYKSKIEAAKQAACVSNLRQIGPGIMAYAADNGGLLPPHAASSYNAANRPWRTYLASHGDGGPWGFGFLYPNYISDHKVFYCPSAPAQHPTAMKLRGSWSPNLNTSNIVRAGYLYNPYFESGRGQIYRRVSQLGSRTVLAMDILFRDYHDNGSWNVLFAGGGVERFKSDSIKKMIEAGGDATLSAEWPAFSQALDTLLADPK